MEIFKSAADIAPDPELANIEGINMEGPFIAESKKGAQNGKYISKPDVALFEEVNKASGNMIKLVTLAPEEQGSAEFIEKLHDKVAISVGHTNANYDEASVAFKAGANHVTHLCNAMPPFHHIVISLF